MTNLIIVIFCVQRKCRCAALHKVCGLWLLSFEKSTKKQKLILWQRNETQTLLIIIENHYHWPFPKVPPTKFPGEPYLDWGSKIGDEEDKKKLREIITKELKKPENRGNLEFFPQYSDHYTSSSGMDEDLAEAIDEEFYNSYKTWKDDHSKDTVNQKVIVVVFVFGNNDKISWNSGSPFCTKSWESSRCEGNSTNNSWRHPGKETQSGKLLEGQN